MRVTNTSQLRASRYGTGSRITKYRNKPIVVDDIRFDSKAEARRYEVLKLLRAAGKIKWFTRQVPFYLPGGIVYRADFLEVDSNGQVTITDVTGIMTRVKINKLKTLKALYGIEVQIIK